MEQTLRSKYLVIRVIKYKGMLKEDRRNIMKRTHDINIIDFDWVVINGVTVETLGGSLIKITVQG